MEQEELMELARQLRKPSGEGGLKVANFMNEGNKLMNLSTIDALNVKANDSILEIGMGNGFFVKNIVSVAPTVKYTGCDFSEIMVHEAEKLNEEIIKTGQASFVHTSADKLPFADNSFNKVFTINTTYFWENPAAVLAEFKRVLKKNGLLIISIRPKHVMEMLPVTNYGFTKYSKEELYGLVTSQFFAVNEIKENKEPVLERNGQKIQFEHLILVAQAG